MSADDQTLYFAYGSNMLGRRLAASSRAPSARFIGAARLGAHRLTFDKRGADRSGKCNIHPTDSTTEMVFGVLYAIEADDLPALDAAEGGYRREAIAVDCLVSGRRRKAETYRALPDQIDATLRPFDWYHAIVLEGARQAGHPADYLRRLRAQPAIRDHDDQRRERHFELLRGG